MKSKTKRLYGDDVDPRNWRHMDYVMVLEDKIRLAGIRITELNSIHYLDRDSSNIMECLKSIQVCREMIKELEA